MDYVACLKALTPEAKAALGSDLRVISSFPFRVGRESRHTGGDKASDSRRRPDSKPTNDLYLPETGSELNISREHFLIEHQNGNYLIVDRGSSCGTLVEGDALGDKRQSVSRKLEHQDVIIVGTSRSKFVFKFLLKNP